MKNIFLNKKAHWKILKKTYHEKNSSKILEKILEKVFLKKINIEKFEIKININLHFTLTLDSLQKQNLGHSSTCILALDFLQKQNLGRLFTCILALDFLQKQNLSHHFLYFHFGTWFPAEAKS